MKIHDLITIALPTYNNHALLIEQLIRIRRQLVDGVVVNVFDNDSNPSAESVIKNEFQDYKDWINIETNNSNIGADANILKCFSKCTTKWLWVLSINDPIDDDAISNVMFQLQSHKKAIFINFVEGEHVSYTFGFEDFCNNVPSYSRAFFISVCIYNVKILQKYFYYYNEFLSTNNGQLLLVLKCLEIEGGECAFPNKKILENETPSTWNKNSFLKRSLLLFNAFNNESKKTFKNSLGIQIQHLLLYYNGMSRILGEIKFYEQFCNIILIIFSGSPLVFFNKMTYKLFAINLVILVWPKFYSKLRFKQKDEK